MKGRGGIQKGSEMAKTRLMKYELGLGLGYAHVIG